MKKMTTATIETSASVSWLLDERDQQRPGPCRQRVHAELGGQRALDVPADQQQQADQQDKHAAVVQHAGRRADTIAQAAGNVVVQGPGRMDLPRVAGDDPPDGEYANCRDDDRQRGRDPATLTGRADHANDERDYKGRREYRADEADGLGYDISEPSRLGPRRS
jgi:hypothetical protein